MSVFALSLIVLQGTRLRWPYLNNSRRNQRLKVTHVVTTAVAISLAVLSPLIQLLRRRLRRRRCAANAMPVADTSISAAKPANVTT